RNDRRPPLARSVGEVAFEHGELIAREVSAGAEDRLMATRVEEEEHRAVEIDAPHDAFFARRARRPKTRERTAERARPATRLSVRIVISREEAHALGRETGAF